ncbi:alpha/beta hydrolase [uncultured Hymenobacter sp.]|uniref:alpha/beta hydrolase n=1 Tax=uncultured Hymenobacter sp. TaxID=170016 RepID=UPI0035CA8F2E
MTLSRLLLAPLALLLTAAALLLATELAAAYPSRRTADLPYVAATASDFDAKRHVLDVYQPRKAAPAAGGYPVVVFIHGGSWNSGSKGFYSFIGRRLAKQGVVAVIINYRLAPQVQIPQMAADCARALAWTVQNIKAYGGDPARIFTMGHSAGGGLAALLATDNALLARHGLPQNPVRGALLDDPAGLDMYEYLTKLEYEGDAQYLGPWGQDPAGWKAHSALYKLTPAAPPFLLFIGEKTYPSILHSSRKFQVQLAALGHPAAYTVLPGKRHVPMVLQHYWQNNVIYKELLRMVNE